jgi:hypothetical protein
MEIKGENKSSTHNIFDVNIIFNIQSYLLLDEKSKLFNSCRIINSYRLQIGLDLIEKNFIDKFFENKLFNTRKYKLTGINITLDIEAKELSIPRNIMVSLQKLKIDRNITQASTKIIYSLNLNLNNLIYASNLKILILNQSIQMSDLMPLGNCNNLSILEIYNSSNLVSLAGLERCTDLTVLYLNRCFLLEDITTLQNCNNLKRVELHEANSLEDVSILKFCKYLHRFMLTESLVIEQILFETCFELESFNVSGCPYLSKIKLAKTLSHITISRCHLVNNLTKLLETRDFMKGLKYSDDPKLSIEQDKS